MSLHSRIVSSRAALSAARLADALDAILDILEHEEIGEITTAQLREWRDAARKRSGT